MSLTHGVVCNNCGEETFKFERFCHICNYDRWNGEMPDLGDHPVK